MYALERDPRYSRVANVIDGLERQMVREGRSPSTLRAYRWAYDDLIKFAGIRNIGELTRDILERWQDELVRRHVSPRSRALAATAIRRLIRYAADDDLVDLKLERALANVRAPRLRPRPIPEDDLVRIKAFLAPRRPRMSVIDLRDRALFWYLLTTGARVSEALQVTKSEAREALVVQKGGSQKVLRIPPAVAQLVQDYLDARGDNVEWLWVTHDASSPMHRLDPAAVREIWRKLARRVGVKPFTTHQLRHTCATELLDAGVPELAVAEHLGHVGLATIHVYAQVRDAQRRQVAEAMENLVRSYEPQPPALLPRLTPRVRRPRKR